jgi:dipeptidyl aminopeptidase/acylaminoacyl peptidase
LHVLDLASGQEIALPARPSGVVSSINFSPDSRRVGFVIDSATSPGDVYAISLADARLERWTMSESGGLDAGRFVEPTLLHYPTFDKVAGKPRTIPALYYRPRGIGPFPVIIHFHGGPASQSRPEFDPQVQSWVDELGIAVLEPNVRGSSGYGKTYTALDNGYKREDAIKDVGALLDWVAQQPELDPKRVGVHGGSYGGYMTLATMTHFNDRLRAGAELVGQSNFVTFLEHTASYRRDLRRVEYGDERDPKMREFLQRTAPVTNAAKINRPLFVAQGTNDPRVPEEESRQIVDRVRANGNVVWYLRASDEGHGFRKRSNEDYLRAATALFWQTQLFAGGLNRRIGLMFYPGSNPSPQP